MTTLVALPPPAFKIAPKRSAGSDRCPSDATQLGHWKPTDAGFMHSPQISRWQRWQEMPVIRSGWR
jgi:hypothetical protein